ncbi:MAG: MBL fold metallo-hydrolase [Deltaproteobacteria bacterium]|nr:MBL fold metallo-hydrolase [Deltaproteobacteria bacterium]
MNTPPEKPRIVELRPSIFQLNFGWPSSHVYLVKGRAKNVLIDTGTAANFPRLALSLAELDLGPRDIHLVVLTHEHSDHIGACAYLFGNSVIAAHPLAANKIELQDEFVTMRPYLDADARPFQADLWLEAGTSIELGNYRLRVLHTPGHCSGCVCLHEPEQGLLFTGDTVFVGGALSGIFVSGSISDYVHSLQALSSLRLEEFYPGHGPISKTPREDILKAVNDSRALLEDSKILFGALDTKRAFDRILTGVRRTKK